MNIKSLLKPSSYKQVYRLLNNKVMECLFEDCARIRRVPQHLDIINLGSKPAKYSMDYSDSGVKGYNLAVGPQTLEYDFRMLKNYHSFLDDKGARILLLPLCPFSMCKYRYTAADGDAGEDLRYYPILHHSQINNYREVTYTKWVKRPLLSVLSSPKNLRTVLRALKNRARGSSEKEMDAAALEISAKPYLDRWKKETGLSGFSAVPDSSRLLREIGENKRILAEIAEFCAARGIRPVIVLPPVSPAIMSRISDDFLRECLYNPLSATGLPVLDFMQDPAWTTPGNFSTALFLNSRARREFTKEIINRLRSQSLLPA